MMLSILSCAHQPFVYLLWRNLYSSPLPSSLFFRTTFLQKHICLYAEVVFSPLAHITLVLSHLLHWRQAASSLQIISPALAFLALCPNTKGQFPCRKNNLQTEDWWRKCVFWKEPEIWDSLTFGQLPTCVTCNRSFNYSSLYMKIGVLAALSNSHHSQ